MSVNSLPATGDVLRSKIISGTRQTVTGVGSAWNLDDKYCQLYGYCQIWSWTAQSKEMLPKQNFYCQKTFKMPDLIYLPFQNCGWQCWSVTQLACRLDDNTTIKTTRVSESIQFRVHFHISVVTILYDTSTSFLHSSEDSLFNHSFCDLCCSFEVTLSLSDALITFVSCLSTQSSTKCHWC